MLVAVQIFVLGLYLPPVLDHWRSLFRPRRSFQCQSKLRCDRLVPRARYSCPWLSKCPYSDCISHQCLKSYRQAYPPQTIISVPVQTPVCWYRASGALVVLVAVQLSVLGLYLPPVLRTRDNFPHPRRSFHCRSRLRCGSVGHRARW